MERNILSIQKIREAPIGRRLRAAIALHELRVEVIAEEAGLSRATLYRILSGEREASALEISRIEAAIAAKSAA